MKRSLPGCLPVSIFNQKKRNRQPLTSVPQIKELTSDGTHLVHESLHLPSMPSDSIWESRNPQLQDAGKLEIRLQTRMYLSAVQIEKLITMVHDRPCIWDKRQDVYQNRNRKDRAWGEIVEELHAGDWKQATWSQRKSLLDYIKTRWNSCRDQFRRELKDKGKCGDGRKAKRPYLYSQQLQFLTVVMEVGPTRENLVHSEVGSDETKFVAVPLEPQMLTTTDSTPTSMPESASDTSSSVSTTAVLNTPPSRSPGRIRVCNVAPTYAIPNTLTQIDQQVLEHLRSWIPDSQEDIFCRSLAHFLKRVTPERQIRCQSTLLGVVEMFSSPGNPHRLVQAVEYFRGVCEGAQAPTLPPTRPSQQRPYLQDSSQPMFFQDRVMYSQHAPYARFSPCHPPQHGHSLAHTNTSTTSPAISSSHEFYDL
ncbi:spermatogenesis-associated protein 22 isoform X1 [Rhinoderma darwinii]|uniref:spermatogenesis-associated protein 22 isoform X1 n=1 Tax=Rhinoderma darwinii TaxID=43563 RepID=UPI003F66F166